MRDENNNFNLFTEEDIMTLEQCKRVLRLDYQDAGEYNRDVGIYQEGNGDNDYCILYHYEAEEINTNAIYICAR